MSFLFFRVHDGNGAHDFSLWYFRMHRVVRLRISGNDRHAEIKQQQDAEKNPSDLHSISTEIGHRSDYAVARHGPAK